MLSLYLVENKIIDGEGSCSISIIIAEVAAKFTSPATGQEKLPLRLGLERILAKAKKVNAFPLEGSVREEFDFYH